MISSELSGSRQVVPLDHQAPVNYMPFAEFVQQFSLRSASTEQLHEKTKNLSQTMQSDIVQGLHMLLEADQAVFEGFEQFIPTIESLAPELAARIKAGGRVFLVGAGSSGRVAIDLAAKCSQTASCEPKQIPKQIRGIIAGGASAMMRAKEGVEDSAAEGEKCLQSFDLKPEDTVFLISASGSSSFNVGCGHFAANQGAKVFYFYNNRAIPSRTHQLFRRQNNSVRPLELDIGPQAISGSTRLQAASLAEMCLGALLGAALLGQEERFSDAAQYPRDLLGKMRMGNELLARHLETIGQFAKREADVFLSPDANFRKVRDHEAAQGYVTMVGEKDCLRAVLVDATEIPPTFSTSSIRKETEFLQKRAEFRAYLAGECDNRAAWAALLGRPIDPEDLADTDKYLLAIGAGGHHSYSKRPVGAGNFVIGVTHKANALEGPNEVLNQLCEAVSSGGDAGMIVLSKEKMPPVSGLPFLTLCVDEIPTDHLGLVETLLLKQILNLISNSSMTLSGKVHGNRMIDVRASNYKLIDRSLRLIKAIWADSERPMPLLYEELYYYTAEVCTLKKSFEERGVYTPSVVKIMLGLMYLDKTPEAFQEVLDFLAARQERLDFLSPGSPPFTFCIDGGGSKTLLQVIDAQGRIVPLTKYGTQMVSVETGASNINVVQEHGVRVALRDLFVDLKVGESQIPVQNILPTSTVVAGMAGVGLPQNRMAVTSLFEELGIKSQALHLLTDADLALRLHQGNGIILIAGTGSVCFAEKEGVRQRIGGLGPVLGDEGSGYKIALQAMTAVLAEEFGYGPRTSLTPALKAFFNVEEMKSLLPDINSRRMSPAQIADAAPVVFENASAQDPVAMEIIAKAAHELRQLVATALKLSQLAHSELHLWGGIFKDRFVADQIIEQLREETDGRGIKIVNQSSENATVLFARMFGKM